MTELEIKLIKAKIDTLEKRDPVRNARIINKYKRKLVKNGIN